AAGDGDAQQDAKHGGYGEADEELVQADQDVPPEFAGRGELQEFDPDVGDGRQDQRPSAAATRNFPGEANDQQRQESADGRRVRAVPAQKEGFTAVEVQLQTEGDVGHR